MAGKKTTEKDDESWVDKVEQYSRKIWLAGLGVYSKIDSDGSKIFDELVKDGEKAEKRVKKAGSKLVDEARASSASARFRVEDVKDLALGKWGAFEEAFDKRLNSAISRLGIPSRDEVKTLHAKVETLTRHIEKLTAAAAKVAEVKSPASSSVASKLVSARSATKPVVKAPAKPASKPTAKAPAASKAATRPAATKKPTPAKKPVAIKPAASTPATPDSSPVTSTKPD